MFILLIGGEKLGKGEGWEIYMQLKLGAVRTFWKWGMDNLLYLIPGYKQHNCCKVYIIQVLDQSKRIHSEFRPTNFRHFREAGIGNSAVRTSPFRSSVCLLVLSFSVLYHPGIQPLECVFPGALPQTCLCACLLWPWMPALTFCSPVVSG